MMRSSTPAHLRRLIAFVAFVGILSAGAWEQPGLAQAPRSDPWGGFIDHVSPGLDTPQAEGTQSSERDSISHDGRFVVFESAAGNLVEGDTNYVQDVFVRDRQLGTTERVSVASDGTEGNDQSVRPTISADGRYVAFMSWATNLVADDVNGHVDVFVHDRVTHETVRVSLTATGGEADGDSSYPAISGDGRRVAFLSFGTNLVPGATTMGLVYVRDRDTDGDGVLDEPESSETVLASVSSLGSPANASCDYASISADGSAVTFITVADNLVPNDFDGSANLFLRDLGTGETRRVDVASDGTGGDLPAAPMGASLSADGRLVAYTSDARNLVPGDTNNQPDVFLFDRVTSETTRVSLTDDDGEADGGSFWPSMSADGRYVAFMSYATNLAWNNPPVTNYYNVYVRDRQTGETTRIGIQPDGSAPSDPMYNPSISGDGSAVAFFSSATNLTPGIYSRWGDMFVAVPLTTSSESASVPATGGSGSIDVTTLPTTRWTPWSMEPWLTWDPPSGQAGSGTVTWHVAPNLDGYPRMAFANVGSYWFII